MMPASHAGDVIIDDWPVAFVRSARAGAAQVRRM